ncbi:MAG TPA: Spx/MgsR family RNA polymerase-binding regulatory protein [Polyangia bacterium]|jgi:arsenate reductase|nr:Spx/MgsR family RNA polymerase-binding regulatory protein [Polyangia bacterium]
MTVTVYQYPKCSTCRKALKWLDARGVTYRSIDIVKQPPSRAELDRVRKAAAVPVRKMFNVSGESYRAGGWKDKLDATSDADAIAALAADGKLIKRPLVTGDGVALVGFDEAAWTKTF